MNERQWKLLDILSETSSFFAGKKIENARLQAEILLANVLNMRQLDLYLEFERPLTAAEVDAYRKHVKKRLDGMPVQYITGETGFRELILNVSEAVLIPRPETEILVQIALDRLADLTAPRVLDLGCGSGAIALAIAQEHPSAQITATDISPQALEVTQQNAERNEIPDRLTLLCGDLFAPIAAERFDAILSNPPYVCHGEIATLAPEVRDHEPHQALDGGADGLDFYRRIAAEAPSFLTPTAFLCLEAGDTQAPPVSSLLKAAGFSQADIHPDLNDISRVVLATV